MNKIEQKTAKPTSAEERPAAMKSTTDTKRPMLKAKYAPAAPYAKKRQKEAHFVSNKDYARLESSISYTFKAQSLLQQALAHPSAQPYNKQFERLEFLGDRVLGVLMATLLLETFPLETEGSLAKRLAVLVSRETCQAVASTIQLEMYLDTICDAGADSNLNAILADGMESLLGAMYLDGGLAPCDVLVRAFWQPYLHESKEPPKDPKSTLQEWLQKRGKPAPSYVLVETTGPAHQPELVYEVKIEGMPPFSGKGGSRRLAEKEAALAALIHIQENKN